MDAQRSCQPTYHQLASIFQETDTAPNLKNELLVRMMTTHKLSLIEFLHVAPPEVFVYYISTITLLSQDRRRESPKLEHFWGTLVLYVFLPNSPPNQQLECPYQSLHELILSSVSLVYKKGGQQLLEQMFAQLPDLEITPENLFLMYCLIEEDDEDRGKYTGVRELLKSKGALNQKNYLPQVKVELKSAVRPLAYYYCMEMEENYNQMLEQLQPYVEGCSGLGYAVGEMLDEHRDQDLIKLFGELLLNMMRAETSREYLLIVLQAVALYFKLVQLQHDFPECFQEAKPVMLLRLFPQILFRGKLVGSPVLVYNYFKLEKTIHGLPQSEQVDFRRSAMEMMVAAVALRTEKQDRKESQKVLVGNLASLVQKLLSDMNRSDLFYLLRNWSIPQFQALQALPSQVKLQSYPKYHSSYIDELTAALQHAIVEFRVERVFLCLLALKDYVQPLRALEEEQASRLFVLLDCTLTLCKLYTPLHQNYLSVVSAIHQLCCFFMEYSDCSRDYNSLPNCYKIDLSATIATGQRTYQIIENVMVDAHDIIRERRRVYPVTCIYKVWKLAELNTGQVKIPDSEFLKSAPTYDEPKFNLTRWVFWVYYKHQQDLMGLERLLMAMTSACQEESLACVMVPTIMLQMWVGASSKKKQGAVDVDKLLTTVFEKYMFENKMERHCKIGFLNLPTALMQWEKNDDARALYGKVEQLMGRLDLSKLAQAYADIGLFKTAIRYMQQHIRWLNNEQKVKAPIQLYWLLYCYQVRMSSNLRQISFETIAQTLQANRTGGYDSDCWLFAEDRELFQPLNAIFLQWTTKMVDAKGEFNDERELLKTIKTRVSHLCQAISKVAEPCQKKSKYQMLLMARKITKVVEICRCALAEKNGRAVGLPPNSGLLPGEYQLLKKSFKDQKTRTAQLEECLNDIVSMQLPDTFRVKLMSNVLLLVRGKLKQCFSGKDAQLYQNIANRMEHASFQFLVSRRMLTQPPASVSQFEQKDFMARVRWQFYQNKKERVGNIIEWLMFERSSQPKDYKRQALKAEMKRSRDLMELLFYLVTSKSAITTVFGLNILQPALAMSIEYTKPRSGEPQSDAAKHFCVQSAQYVCKLLNQIYLTQITQPHLKDIMTLSQHWIQLCRANKQAEVAEQLLFEATKIILKEMRAVTDDEAEKFLIGNKVENYFEDKSDLIKGIAVELLISNYAAKEPVKRKFLEGLLTRVALKTPEESIWWVARLAHYCHHNIAMKSEKPLGANEIDPKILVAKLFDQTDIALAKFGTGLYKSLESQVDKNVYAFLAHLYSAMGLHPLEAPDPKLPKHLKLGKEVKLPFVRQTMIREVNAREPSPLSKCQTVFLQTKCVNHLGQLYDSKLILKAEFTLSNLCLQSMASQLFCQLIPTELDITYTIVRLSKYVMMVEYLAGYRTVKSVIDVYNKEMGGEKKSEPNEANKKALAPVLPKLFDSLKDPEWWSTRVTYTRCTAIWSMVGSILGLGDRHTGNIMIHQPTGNIVHIDYQMLLDSGKNLKYPEFVPFRMTPNIEAPMGMFGPYCLFYLYSLQEVQRIQQLSTKITNWTEMFAARSAGLANWGVVILMVDKIYKRLMERDVFELIKLSKDPVLLARMYPGWNHLE